jgi:hypothetical protein
MGSGRPVVRPGGTMLSEASRYNLRQEQYVALVPPSYHGFVTT